MLPSLAALSVSAPAVLGILGARTPPRLGVAVIRTFLVVIIAATVTVMTVAICIVVTATVVTVAMWTVAVQANSEFCFWSDFSV